MQLSDLHIGSRVDDGFLSRVFDRVRALEPAIVVYTGDLTNSTTVIPLNANAMLSRLPRGADGTFAILGNHDYGHGWSHGQVAHTVASIARNSGVTVLRNAVAEVRGLQIGGLDDLWAGQFKLEEMFSALDSRRPSLVLSHNPDTLDLPGWRDYSGWVLAGHTHGGQCKPPFLPPPLLPVKNRRYTAGEFSLPGGRRLYINRGLGHLLKVRFNVRPEVTVFRLVTV